MTKLERRSVRLLATLLVSGPVIGADDLEFYSARITSVAHQVAATIRPTLDERGQKILDEIEFEAPLAWDTNADARRTFGNRRIVEFNAGFLAVTDWLALAMVADWAGHDGCLKEYSTYLSQLIGNNSRRVFKGKEMRFVHDFDSYAATSHGQCEGALGESAYDEHKDGIRDEILDSIIATVVLHEIAHHVLDHVSGSNANYMQKRLREMDADRWAISIAVKVDYDLRTAVPLFLFLAATGGGSLEDQLRGSHPSGLHRVRDLLVQTRALLDKKNPLGAHLMDASIDDLNRSLR